MTTTVITDTEYNVTVTNEEISIVTVGVQGPPGVPISINDLTDVNITGSPAPASGDVLTFNGTQWIHANPGALSEVNDLTSSVTWTTVPDAYISETSVTQHQGALTITESQISDLGSYLTDITGQSIGSLSDVSLTGSPAPASGDILTFDGVSWVHTTPVDNDIAAVWGNITGTLSNQTDLQTALDGKSDTSHNHTLDSLSNVTITGNTSGEILKWDGAAWINNTLAEAGIAASGHTHVMADITDSDWINASGVTFENLDANGDVGTGAAQVAAGSHLHTGVYAPLVGSPAVVPDANISQSSVTQHQAAIDHGSIAGLGDDDHTIYLLIDGTRAMTGNLAMGGNNIDNVNSINGPSGATDLTITKASGSGDVVLSNNGAGGIIIGGNSYPEVTGTNGQVLTTNGAGTLSWSSISLTVNGLSDAVITTPADNEVLAYDIGSGNWINQTAAEAGLAVAGHTHAIGDLSDVDLTGSPAPSNGDVLTYNGVAWVHATPTSGVTDHGALTGLADDDHTQYVLADGSRTVTGELVIQGTSISTITSRTDGASSVALMNLDNSSSVSQGAFKYDESVDQTSLETNNSNGLFIKGLSGPVTVTSGSGTNISLTPGTTGSLVLDGLNWPQTDGTAGYVLSTNGSGTLSWVAQTGGTSTFLGLTDTPSSFAGSGGYFVKVNTGASALEFVADPGYLQNIVEDTTPQLGGNLNVNGNSIVSTSAGNIVITPDTTGSIVLDGLNWPQADGSADQVLKTDGAGNLSWTANAGTGIANVVDDTTPQLGGDLDVNGNSIVSVASGDVSITPNGTGKTKITNLEAAVPINNQTGTSYTGVLADAGKLVTMSNASANTFTIPANSSVAYPVGTWIRVTQLGAGATTIAITTDTLNYNSTFTATLAGQYSEVILTKVTSTSWVMSGDLGLA